MSELADAQVILGVSGSIAAYKAVYLTRLLVDAGAQVHPVLTGGAQRFVGPLSFAATSGRRPITDVWSAAEAGQIGHVELAHRASVVVLAPASADLLARLAAGRADDAVTALCLATRAPLVVAPAMEDGMWQHAATVAHVDVLEQQGAQFVAPTAGKLASGRTGRGRMAEPEQIVEAIAAAISPKPLQGRHILVTAGPTREAFDPVRFLTNPASGKMGFALARLAHRQGARVTLVCGPSSLPPPPGVEHVPVTTTQQMLDACAQQLSSVDALLMAAAPCDWRPEHSAPHKMKKQQDGAHLDVALVPTADVLGSLDARSHGVVTVGFAAETRQVMTHAQEKLQRKNLDLIVANDVGRSDVGFGTDVNEVVVVDRDGGSERLARQSKDAIAAHLLARVSALLPSHA